MQLSIFTKKFVFKRFRLKFMHLYVTAKKELRKFTVATKFQSFRKVSVKWVAVRESVPMHNFQLASGLDGR